MYVVCIVAGALALFMLFAFVAEFVNVSLGIAANCEDDDNEEDDGK